MMRRAPLAAAPATLRRAGTTTGVRSLSRCPEGALLAGLPSPLAAPSAAQRRRLHLSWPAAAAAPAGASGPYSSSSINSSSNNSNNNSSSGSAWRRRRDSSTLTVRSAGSPLSSLDGGGSASASAAAATAAATPAAAASSAPPTPSSLAAAAAASKDPQLRRAQEAELVALAESMPKQDSGLSGIALWLGAAVAFGGGVYATLGAAKAEEYFAGYLLEQSLSVDNLFVFVLVFRYFRTPPEGQASALNWGIGTAAVLRLVMILLGSELITVWRPVLLVFAAALVYSAYGLSGAGGDAKGDDDDLSDNAIVRFCRSFLPVADHYDGAEFFTTARRAREVAALLPPYDRSGPGGGPATVAQVTPLLAVPAPSMPDAARVATPLLLTLAVIELSDVVFAVDSIPAVFGVTTDPFIVYTSNVFAIVSLRAVYRFVSGAMTDLKYLDKALAFVLAFIGLKLGGEYFGAEVPTAASLAIVGGALAAGVGASLAWPDDDAGGEGGQKDKEG